MLDSNHLDMDAQAKLQSPFIAVVKIPRTAREVGAASGAMAFTALVFNPLDVVKTKLQTQSQLAAGNAASAKLYASARHCLRTVLREQGFVHGLWLPGLTAAVLRDVINGGIRMGLYPTFVKGITDGCSGLSLPMPGLGVKILAGWCTGILGACAGNPTDLIKVRLQAESGRVEAGVYTTGLYKGGAPAYRSASHAFATILRDEGISGLFRGCTANVARAAFLTSAQMSSYDQTKTVLSSISAGDGVLAAGCSREPVKVAIASFMSGVVAATVAAPADLVRSRVMDDSRAGKSRALYSGAIDCAFKTLRYEGPFALWSGWVPAYLRLGPQFMLGFPTMELLRTQVFGLPPL